MPAARLDMVTLSCTSFSGANLTGTDNEYVVFTPTARLQGQLEP